MNQRAAKKIRKIINPQDAITKRVYRRAKKAFKKINSPEAKRDFLLALENLHTNTKIKL